MALLRAVFSHIFQNNSFSPSSIRSMRGIFFRYSLENLVRAHGGKTHETGLPSDWLPLELLTLSWSTLSLQEFINYSSGFLTLTLVPTEILLS